jgi:hypothetical protein
MSGDRITTRVQFGLPPFVAFVPGRRLRVARWTPWAARSRVVDLLAHVGRPRMFPDDAGRPLPTLESLHVAGVLEEVADRD